MIQITAEHIAQLETGKPSPEFNAFALQICALANTSMTQIAISIGMNPSN